MAKLNCPLCSTTIRIPEVRPFIRIQCQKCHTSMHLNKDGKAVLGAPPDVEDELEDLKERLREIRSRIPVKGIVAVLIVTVVVGLPAYFLLGSSQGLAQVAEEAAQAVAQDDAGYIRSIAAPGTSDQAKEWLDEAHRQLVQRRQNWYAKEEVIEVHVASEDASQGKGVVGISIHPGFGSARDVSLADPAAMTARAPTPCDLQTVWTQDWLGRWMLDGRDTVAKGRATP